MSWWLALLAAMVGAGSCFAGASEEWCEEHRRGPMLGWGSAAAAFGVAGVVVAAVMPW